MSCLTISPVAEGAKLSLDLGKRREKMTAANSFSLLNPQECRLPSAYGEERWYAAYTCANHEKRVAAQLNARAVEHFVPLYNSVRRWRDRRIQLALPLFPGYVFLRLALRDKLRVLQIPSLVHLVSFNGQPAALSDEEMDALRHGLTEQLNVQPHPYLTVGRRVRVASGPLAGLEGIIVRKKNHLRFVISLNLIMRSVSVEMDDADLVPAP
jgi:transcription antitermination factor NusG